VYDRGVDPVNAFILAGGKSSRMGQDKAFMQLGRQTLLQRALELARTVGGEPWIVGNAAKFATFAPVVEDVYPECGPLGGIHAALSKSGSDLNLMIAVDLPFLQPDFLKYLLSRSRESGAVVAVPRAGGSLQPLCGVYRRGFGAVAERSLRAGRNRIDPLFAEVHTCIIEPDELKQLGFSEQQFSNVNTQQDWEAASLLLPS
jgi:molybdopterin-guanine dinucleotide biosynthesis protein A